MPASVADRMTSALARFDAVPRPRVGRLMARPKIGTFAPIEPAEPAPNMPADMPAAAGLAVRALDTGRVLMLQRSLEDVEDPAAGTWEFPGGKLDPGEDPLAAARREWGEEVGLEPPEAEPVATWTSPDGVYAGFVVDIEQESFIPPVIATPEREVINPDDPDGDMIEVTCWWLPSDAAAMPALREELKGCEVWQLLGVNDGGPAAMATDAFPVRHGKGGRFLPGGPGEKAPKAPGGGGGSDGGIGAATKGRAGWGKPTSARHGDPSRKYVVYDPGFGHLGGKIAHHKGQVVSITHKFNKQGSITGSSVRKHPNAESAVKHVEKKNADWQKVNGKAPKINPYD